ncbi:MAG: glycosyltransferase family 87 protein [Alphaproteobacteria bacterium]|nr:glycosyltransferase family 87 protein [Alphaproteobacteria bacterium]
MSAPDNTGSENAPPDVWLTRQRLIAWSSVFLAVELVIFVLLVLQQTNIAFGIGKSSIDFLSFYAAGKLVLAGTPALAYDQAAHYIAQQQATAPGVPYVYFYYPPVFLLLCAGFATLPYGAAFLVFEVVTFVLFAAVLRRVLGESGRAWLIPVIAFPATFWNFGQGQNAFLTAALFGTFGLLLDRRPYAAGAALGALCFKPHLALLTPIALAASGRWRAFIAAGLMAILLVLLSVLLLGRETWEAYFAAMAGADATYTSGRINFAGFVSLFGGLRLMEIAVTPAYVIQAAATLACAAVVFLAWRRPLSGAQLQAALLSATLLAVPLVLLYDQMIAVLALAWLLRAAGPAGLHGWEKLVIVAAYPLTLMAPVLAIGLKAPIALVVDLALIALCLRRSFRPA